MENQNTNEKNPLTVPPTGSTCLVTFTDHIGDNITEIKILRSTINFVQILYVESKAKIWIEKSRFSLHHRRDFIEVLEILSKESLSSTWAPFQRCGLANGSKPLDPNPTAVPKTHN